MDTGSTLLGLLLSLLAFAAASLVEVSAADAERQRLQRMMARQTRGVGGPDPRLSPPRGLAAPASFVKTLAFAAAAVLTVASVTQPGRGWVLAFPALVGLLAATFLIETGVAALAGRYGPRVAVWSGPVLRLLGSCLAPLAWAQRMAVRRRGPAEGGQATAGGADATGGEAPRDPAAEPLDENERRMIRTILAMDETVAREIMVPRVDIVAVSMGTPVAELTEKMIEHGHSRVPVFKESIDQIVGVAYARDILHRVNEGEGLQGLVDEGTVRPALFIPESKTLEELLSDFRERRVHMAIVVDEYGGVSGLVTIEDLLEEIVGEIRDEFDVGEPEIQVISDTEMILDARVSVDQLRELLHVDFEGDGFDTLGGFVYQRLGRIPGPGAEVDYAGVKIVVVSTAGRRVKRLRVTTSRPPASPPRASA